MSSDKYNVSLCHMNIQSLDSFVDLPTISLNTPGSSWNLAATLSINSYWCSPTKGCSDDKLTE